MKCVAIAIVTIAFTFSSTKLAAAQAGATIFFDDFLLDNGGLAQENFNAFFLWDVSEGSVDLVGPSILDPLPNLLERFVDLGGSTNDAGRFATRLPQPLIAGTLYNLSFNYKSVDGGPSAANVSLGSQSFRVETSSTAFLSFDETFTFNGVASSPLVFQDEGSDTAGIGIDNVVLSVAVAVPEPAFVPLTGAIALMLLRTSRRPFTIRRELAEPLINRPHT